MSPGVSERSFEEVLPQARPEDFTTMMPLPVGGMCRTLTHGQFAANSPGYCDMGCTLLFYPALDALTR
jgi:hypothetical protein